MRFLHAFLCTSAEARAPARPVARPLTMDGELLDKVMTMTHTTRMPTAMTMTMTKATAMAMTMFTTMGADDDDELGLHRRLGLQ